MTLRPRKGSINHACVLEETDSQDDEHSDVSCTDDCSEVYVAADDDSTDDGSHTLEEDNVFVDDTKLADDNLQTSHVESPLPAAEGEVQQQHPSIPSRDNNAVVFAHKTHGVGTGGEVSEHPPKETPMEHERGTAAVAEVLRTHVDTTFAGWVAATIPPEQHALPTTAPLTLQVQKNDHEGKENHNPHPRHHQGTVRSLRSVSNRPPTPVKSFQGDDDDQSTMSSAALGMKNIPPPPHRPKRASKHMTTSSPPAPRNGGNNPDVVCSSPIESSNATSTVSMTINPVLHTRPPPGNNHQSDSASLSSFTLRFCRSDLGPDWFVDVRVPASSDKLVRTVFNSGAVTRRLRKLTSDQKRGLQKGAKEVVMEYVNSKTNHVYRTFMTSDLAKFTTLNLHEEIERDDIGKIMEGAASPVTVHVYLRDKFGDDGSVAFSL
eukprot:Sro814_g206410.2  (434) ;mRNA; r:44285-45586